MERLHAAQMLLPDVPLAATARTKQELANLLSQGMLSMTKHVIHVLTLATALHASADACHLPVLPRLQPLNTSSCCWTALTSAPANVCL